MRVPQKKFPKIEKLMHRESRRTPRARQTPAQMLAIVKMLNAAYGGTVINKTEH